MKIKYQNILFIFFIFQFSTFSQDELKEDPYKKDLTGASFDDPEVDQKNSIQAIESLDDPYLARTTFSGPAHCVACHDSKKLYENKAGGTDTYKPLPYTLFNLMLAFRDEFPRYEQLNVRKVSYKKRKEHFTKLAKKFELIEMELTNEQVKSLKLTLKINTKKRAESFTNWLNYNLNNPSEKYSLPFLEELENNIDEIIFLLNKKE